MESTGPACSIQHTLVFATIVRAYTLWVWPEARKVNTDASHCGLTLIGTSDLGDVFPRV